MGEFAQMFVNTPPVPTPLITPSISAALDVGEFAQRTANTPVTKGAEIEVPVASLVAPRG